MSSPAHPALGPELIRQKTHFLVLVFTTCFNESVKTSGGAMEGDALINELIRATGLPKAWVEQEFKVLLNKRGLSTQQLTMASLREILAELMQDVLLDAKADLSR